MFCKECGTENLDNKIECIKCKTIINKNLPVNTTEKAILIFSFLGLLSTTIFGIIPIIIIIVAYYAIKKHKDINILKKYKNILLGYLSIVATIVSIFCFYKSWSLYKLAEDYFAWGIEKKYGKDPEYYFDLAVRCESDAELLIYVGILGVPFVVYIIYFLSNISLNMFKKHEEWIINYGIFLDSENENFILNKTNQKIQKKENEELTSDIDQLIKFGELKEKGLITDDEFQRAKEKILEGKL